MLNVWRAWVAIAIGVVMGSGTAHARDVEGLATALVDMRSEVEKLTEELEEARRGRRERRRVVAAQKGQLEAELQRELLRVRQLREAHERKRGEIERAQADERALVPVVEHAMGVLNAHIETSLPFQREARLEAVKSIDGRLKDQLLTSRSALARLWALAEDELRMTRDTGLFRQTLDFEGEPRIADVVRIGMVGMYLRTGDEQVGRLWRSPDGWKVEQVKAPRAAAQIHDLFDAFKKQVRVGYFALPNILTAPEGR